MTILLCFILLYIFIIILHLSYLLFSFPSSISLLVLLLSAIKIKSFLKNKLKIFQPFIVLLFFSLLSFNFIMPVNWLFYLKLFLIFYYSIKVIPLLKNLSFSSIIFLSPKKIFTARKMSKIFLIKIFYQKLINYQFIHCIKSIQVVLIPQCLFQVFQNQNLQGSRRKWMSQS